MSRGMGHVLGGHGATHHMSPSVGHFAWMWGWQRGHMIEVRTHAHKHGGREWHNVVAAKKQGKDVHVYATIRGQQKLSTA